MDQIIEKKLSDASIHFLYFNLSQQFFLYVHARSIHVSIYEKKTISCVKTQSFYGSISETKFLSCVKTRSFHGPFYEKNLFLAPKRKVFMGRFIKQFSNA